MSVDLTVYGDELQEFSDDLRQESQEGYAFLLDYIKKYFILPYDTLTEGQLVLKLLATKHAEVMAQEAGIDEDAVYMISDAVSSENNRFSYKVDDYPGEVVYHNYPNVHKLDVYKLLTGIKIEEDILLGEQLIDPLFKGYKCLYRQLFKIGGSSYTIKYTKGNTLNYEPEFFIVEGLKLILEP